MSAALIRIPGRGARLTHGCLAACPAGAIQDCECQRGVLFALLNLQAALQYLTLIRDLWEDKMAVPRDACSTPVNCAELQACGAVRPRSFEDMWS